MRAAGWVVMVGLSCGRPAVRGPSDDGLPHFATDAEFRRAIAGPIGPDPVMPAFPIDELEAFTVDGEWAVGNTPAGVPVMWSTSDGSRAATVPNDGTASRWGALVVAPNGAWIAWQPNDKPSTRFYRFDPAPPALVQFHVIDGLALDQPDVSSDGRLLHVGESVESKDVVYEVDAAAGTVRPLTHSKLADVGYVIRLDGGRAIRPGLPPDFAPATFTIEGTKLTVRTGTWSKPPAARFESAMWTLTHEGRGVGTLVHRPTGRKISLGAMDGYIVRADERWLITEHQDDRIQVWELEQIARGKSEPVAVINSRMSIDKLAAVVGNQRVVVIAELVRHEVVLNRYSLDPPAHARAWIGDILVRWERLENAPPVWASLDAQAELAIGTSTLKVTATNRGPVAAFRTVAHVAMEPGTPALGPIYFGQLDPGQTITRNVSLDPAITRGPRRITIDVHAVDTSAPPVRLVVLPAWLGNRAAYHAMAKRVVDAARDVLGGAVGQTLNVDLEALDEHGFGFYAGGENVRYQDPYVMRPYNRGGNAALMRVADPADFERHGDMFLLWYLVHEIVHVAGGAGSWEAERTANLVQPYATAEVLKRLGSATPYTPELMSSIYDRYVDALAPYVEPAQRTRIDRYAADVKAPEPFDAMPLAVLAVDPIAYVYWCARLTQLSDHRKVDLATVLRETLH